MLNNKKYNLPNLNILLFLSISMFSTSGYSMVCPTNWSTIEIGYTIDQIIQLCGNPDERAEEKDTVSYTQSGATGQTYGNYYQSQNNYYSQGLGNYQQLKDVKERVITRTRFIYHYPQYTILIFEDGRLVDRQVLPR